METKFTKQKIEVMATKDPYSGVYEPEEIMAYVAGDYAIHGERPYLHITHVPTGTHLIMIKGLLRDAKQLIQDLVDTGVSLEAKLISLPGGGKGFVTTNSPEEEKLVKNVLLKWRNKSREN